MILFENVSLDFSFLHRSVAIAAAFTDPFAEKGKESRKSKQLPVDRVIVTI